MELYSKETVFIIGHGKTNIDNAITEKFKMFFIGFVVDTKTDLIVDLDCTSTIRTTKDFVYNIFINKRLDEFDVLVEKEIERRYFGSSKKAMITAYKDAVKKYSEVKSKYY